MKNHLKKKGRTALGGEGFLPLLFLLVGIVFLAAPLRAEGRNGLGTRGGPLAAEWYQQNWGKTFGGQGTDEMYAMSSTVDGGLILAGGTWSFGSNQGYGDGWLLKLGSAGDVEWEMSYGDQLWDTIFDVRQTPDGGYIATGDRYPPGGSQEAWVMKLTSDGEVVWQNTYGRAEHYDSALSIRPTADGGFILLARTESYDLGGEQGAWVLKLGGSGVIEWQKFLGGAEYDILFSIEQTTDGGYILAGGTYSYSEVPWLSKVWLVKMFPDGDIDWQKTYGGAYSDVAYSVRQSPDGGYVLACWTSFELGDVWVLKTDLNGDMEWRKRYGGPSEDVPTALELTTDGGFLIGGYTSSFGHGSSDGWILKLARDGRLEWQRTFGGSGSDAFNDIVETASGYAATGYTGSFGAGEKDGWCIHFNPVGPGTLLLKTVAAPSHAVSPSMEVGEVFISGFIAATQVSPAVSVTTTWETMSLESDLSEFPGNSLLFTNRGRDHPSGKEELWPVIPDNTTMK